MLTLSLISGYTMNPRSDLATNTAKYSTYRPYSNYLNQERIKAYVKMDL